MLLNKRSGLWYPNRALPMQRETAYPIDLSKPMAYASTSPCKEPASLVLLCHSFPEFWYVWRYQFRALAQAGCHVIAPGLRGYGQTDQPEAVEAYTLLHLVGDLVGTLDALGEQ